MTLPTMTPARTKIAHVIQQIINAAPGIRTKDVYLATMESTHCSPSEAEVILRTLKKSGHVVRTGDHTTSILHWCDEPRVKSDLADERVIRAIPAASVRINMPRYPNAMAWVAGEIGRAA